MQNVKQLPAGDGTSGLICGYLMGPAASGRSVECDEAAAWFADRPRSGSPPLAADRTFVWLHFNLAHTGALPWMKAHAGLGEDFYALIEDSSHATRI